MPQTINFTQDRDNINIKFNAVDSDGDPTNLINATYGADANKLTIVDNGNGSINLTRPDPHFIGVVPVSLSATNESDGSPFASTVNINIIAGAATGGTWSEV